MFLFLLACMVSGDVKDDEINLQFDKITVLDGDAFVETELLYTDPLRDIAILRPKTKLESVKPIRWKVNNDADLIGIHVNYTGYPSELGKVLIRGMISGGDSTNFLMQSFALPGSSGSVVFDNKGRVVGVVSAVMLHGTPYSPHPQLQENMVYVGKLDFINRGFIKEIFNVSRDP